MLVFTDYTAHPQRSLNGFYGQYAMHGSTGELDQELLDSIKEGTYWSMDNIRLKYQGDGNLEVDFYRAKLNEVYVDDDAPDLHLEALLTYVHCSLHIARCLIYILWQPKRSVLEGKSPQSGRRKGKQPQPIYDLGYISPRPLQYCCRGELRQCICTSLY